MDKTLIAKELVKIAKSLLAKTFPTRINFENDDYFLTGKKETNKKFNKEAAEYQNEYSPVKVWVLETGTVLDENNKELGRISYLHIH